MAERGAYAKSDVRRKLLSQTTLALVLEKGHRAVTVAEIAQRAGISEPSVYYHFASKEALWIAALEYFDDENIRPLGTSGAIADMGRRAEAGVGRDHLVRLYAEMAGGAVDPDHPAHAYLQNRWRRSLPVIADDIVRLRAAGLVDPVVEPEQAARFLLAAWEGLQLQKLHGEDFDIRRELEDLVSLVLRVPFEQIESADLRDSRELTT